MRLAQPSSYVSSLFGWHPVEPERTFYFETLEHKVANAPYFAFLGGARELPLESQEFRDWSREVELGRYLVLPMPTGWSDFAGMLARDRRLLLRLFVWLLRYDPAVAVVGNVAFVSTLRFLDWPNVPTSTGKLSPGSIIAHAQSLALGSVVDMQPTAAGFDVCERDPEMYVDRNRRVHLFADAARDLVSCVCDAAPWLPFENWGADKWLWTCLSNDYYGQRQVLAHYAGMDPEIQVRGKIQHGWQTLTGIDGEQGYKNEVAKTREPFFVWSLENQARALAEGMDWGHAIGAPFLYLPQVIDPGPSSRRLLAFPPHSIEEYKIAGGWELYAMSLSKTVKEYGFDGATVCLHTFDYQKRGVRAVFEQRGLSTACVASEIRDPGFLARFRDLVWRHAAVTSERLCTSGFYALALNRPFFVNGASLKQTPPNPWAIKSTDVDWIREHFPRLLAFDDKVHKAYADRELGADCRRDPEELRNLLWGWMF